MVTALSWIASQQLPLAESSVRHLGSGFPAEVAQRRAAATQHGLGDSLAITVLEAHAGQYPFPSLLGAVKAIFFGVGSGGGDARAQLLMYYLWDCGHTCDWQVILSTSGSLLPASHSYSSQARALAAVRL